MSLKNTGQKARVATDLVTRAQVDSLIQQWMRNPNYATGRERIMQIFVQVLNYVEAVSGGAASLNYNDTTTIDLDLSGSNLTATIKLSATAGNDLTSDGTGVFLDVSASPVLDTNDILGGGAVNVTIQDLLDAFAPQETAFAGLTAVGAADGQAPTEAEISAWAIANGVENSIIKYTGTDTSTDATISAFHVDYDGNVTALGVSVSSTFAFASETAVSPASAGAPTVAEIETWATANSVAGQFVRYTGNDTAGDPTTYLFYVATDGEAEELQSPSSAFTVVNDVTTGGTSDALSAEQGKNIATALGITTGDEHFTTFTGAAFPDNQTAKQLFQLIETFFENWATAKGIALTDTDFGTWTDTILTDNSSIKVNVQELATYVENIPTREQSVVNDIAARDALTGVETADMAYVIDASADATVTSGAALYVWDGAAWQKIAEFESLDLTFTTQLADWVAATTVVTDQAVVDPTTNEIYKSNSDRTTGGTWDAAEQANFTKLSWRPNVKQFADNSTVAPASAGAPTRAELQAFATGASLSDTLLGYNGTDVDNNVYTYVAWVDFAGTVAIIEQPSGVANDKVFASVTAVAASDTAAPSRDEFQTWVDSQAITDVLVGYNNTDTDTDEYTYVLWVDASGTAVIIQEPVIPNDKQFADDTTVAPASAGYPTIAEIETFAAAVPFVDGILFYTGTDTDTDTPTHVYWVDQSGNAVLVYEPLPLRTHVTDTALAPALAGVPSITEVQAYVTAQSIQDTVLYYTGTDTDTDEPTFVYIVDSAGVATEVNSPATTPLKTTAFTPTITGTTIASSGAGVNPVNWYIIKIGTYVQVVGRFDHYQEDAQVTITIPNNTFSIVSSAVATRAGSNANYPINITYVDNETYTINRDDAVDGSTPISVIISGLGANVVTADQLTIHDEDDMVSDDFANPPSQQSTAAHVAANKTQSGAGAPVDGTTTAWFVGQIYTDNTATSNNLYIATTASTAPYTAGTGSVWQQIVGGKDHQFAAATTVAAVDTAYPTLAEIQTFVTNASVTDTLVYYTGTDVSTDTPTWVYHADNSGNVRLINRFLIDEDDMASDRVDVAPSQQSVAAHVAANRTQSGSGAPTNNVTTAWFVGQIYVDNAATSNNFYRATTASTNPYVAATGSVWSQMVGGKDRAFADDSTVAPATASRPTVAEMQTFATNASLTDVILYYTGTDVDSDAVTFAYHVDNSGTVTRLESPTLDENDMATDSAVFAPSQQSVKVHIDTNKVQVGTAAPVDGTDGAFFVGQFFWDRTNKKLYEATTASTSPYVAPIGSVWAEIALSNATVFADDTGVAPATAGRPTTAEIDTWATANSHDSKFIYYTGTDTSTDPVTFLFYIDRDGRVDQIEEVFRLYDEDNMASDATDGAPTQQSTKAFVEGQRMQTGAGAPVNGTTTAYFVGQFYYDQTNRVFYTATTASTNPYTAATGSVWTTWKQTRQKVTVNPSGTNNIDPLIVDPPTTPAHVDVWIDGNYDYLSMITVDAGGVVTVDGNFNANYGYDVQPFHNVTFVYFSD